MEESHLQQKYLDESLSNDYEIDSSFDHSLNSSEERLIQKHFTIKEYISSSQSQDKENIPLNIMTSETIWNDQQCQNIVKTKNINEFTLFYPQKTIEFNDDTQKNQNNDSFMKTTNFQKTSPIELLNDFDIKQHEQVKKRKKIFGDTLQKQSILLPKYPPKMFKKSNQVKNSKEEIKTKYDDDDDDEIIFECEIFKHNLNHFQKIQTSIKRWLQITKTQLKYFKDEYSVKC